MTTQPFSPSVLDEIAELLVCDRDTHRVLDRRFEDLGITEPRVEPDPKEEAKFQTMGMQRGVHYYVQGPSKRDRLRYAVNFQHRRSGNKGVLQLVKTLNEPAVYASDPDGFREFCAGLNRILRFHGVEYRDDGEFHTVDPTRTLSEAQQRAAALENKLAPRRIHLEVRKYCRAEYMEENYFHAVVEAYKGLAERIREQTGFTSDGMALMKQAFERPSPQQGGYPALAFNTLATATDRNEHDGLLDFLNGCTRFFRNPMSHTPKVNWHRNVEDAVDCLTLISLLHFILDECHPTSPPQR